MSAQYLSGPWWTNDDGIHPEEEHPPQEAFFRAEFAGTGEARFQVAAQNFYQCWLNGRWLGYGPVRAPHGRPKAAAGRWPRFRPDKKENLSTRTPGRVRHFQSRLTFNYDQVSCFPAAVLAISACMSPPLNDSEQ